MARAYVRLLLASTLAALILGAVINFLVDPYGMHRFVDREGFNRKKPKAGVNSHLVKPYYVLVVRPGALVLGNSRVEVGIDPESAWWPASARPVYNMALPATGINMEVGSLRHVLSAVKPELVVAGLDFIGFAAVHPPPAQDLVAATELEGRLRFRADGSRNQLYPLQHLKDLAATLLSLGALADSVQTLALQGRDDQPDLTGLGFNPMRNYARSVRVEGHHAMFRQVADTYLRSYLHRPLSLYSPGSDTSPELEMLRGLITLCRASGSRLILYIHPYHAHLLEVYRAAGLWPLYEQWKRAVTRVVDEEAAAHPRAAPAELWDFGTFNGVTMEPVPAAGETGTPMQWHWELGHYKREVGDLMLARMLADRSNPKPAAAEFGVRLNSHDIDGQIAAMREARRRYAETHPEVVRSVEQLAASIRAEIRGRPGAR